jgi:subtilisin family serine protease
MTTSRYSSLHSLVTCIIVGLVFFMLVGCRAEDLLADPNDTDTTITDPDTSTLQWHLANTQQLGASSLYDLHLADILSTITGNGIRVAIADVGIQTTHEDLTDNMNSDWAYDFTTGSATVPSPTRSNNHATGVAGIIAAVRNNGLGGHGIAPKATLINLRVIGDSGIDESEEADAMISALGKSHEPHIYNNSWGPSDGENNPNTPNALWHSAISRGVSEGRGSLGTIYTWAAGNGNSHESSNLDSYANHPDVITVGSVDDDGGISYFSESGDNIFLSAPGDSNSSSATRVHSPDVYTNASHSRYRQDFYGTSVSTAMVSGVIALMLEANPRLSWREVREILARTARKPSGSSGWQAFTVNGISYHYHHRYGFGLIDANEAVAAAKNWSESIKGDGIRKGGYSQLASSTVNRGETIRRSITVSSSGINFLESVTLTLSLSQLSSTPYYRHAQLTLMSPSGRTSTLLSPSSCANGCVPLDKWTFSSKAFWGDKPDGEWVLRLEDTRSSTDTAESQTLSNLTLSLHGR